MRSAGLARATGWPHSQRGSISSSSMPQVNCWHSVHVPLDGMITSQRATLPSSTAGWEKETRRLRRWEPFLWRKTRAPSSCATSPLAAGASTRPSLTAKRSAKSAP